MMCRGGERGKSWGMDRHEVIKLGSGGLGDEVDRGGGEILV